MSNLKEILKNGRGAVGTTGVAALEITPGTYRITLETDKVPADDLSVRINFYDSLIPSDKSVVLLGRGRQKLSLQGRLLDNPSYAYSATDNNHIYSFDLSVPTTVGELISQIDVTDGGRQTPSRMTIESASIVYVSSDTVARGTSGASAHEMIIFMGQSGLTGDGTTLTEIDLEYGGADSPHSRLVELSRGTNQANFYRAAPSGETQLARNPLQSNVAGRGYVCPTFHTGKARVEGNPTIGELVLEAEAISGTGFSTDTWGASDSPYLAAKGRITTYLTANSACVPVAIVWRGGETDAAAGVTDSAWQTDFVATMTDLRTAIGSTVPVIIVGMSQFNIDAGGANYIAIDQKQRDVSTYLTNSYYLDVSDLTGTNDGSHPDADDCRTTGRRIAAMIEKVVNPPKAIHRFTYDSTATKFLDEIGGADIHGTQTTVSDATRGTVLAFDNTAITRTSAQVPQQAFSLHCKHKRTGDNAGTFNYILSGTRTDQVRGYALGENFLLIENAAGAMASPLSSTTQDEWYDVILSWDGTKYRFYLDGAEQTLTAINNGVAGGFLEGPQEFQLASASAVGSGSICRLDIIEIYDFAVTTELEAQLICFRD